MGEKTSFVMEHTTCVDPNSLFLAIIDELIIISLTGQVYDSIGIDEDDDVKTFKISYEGRVCKTIKHEIETIDEEKWVYIYSLIEGDALEGKFEKIRYAMEVRPSEEGSICKISSTYYPIGDFELASEDIKGIKEKSAELFKAIEAYLVKYPWVNGVGY